MIGTHYWEVTPPATPAVEFITSGGAAAMKIYVDNPVRLRSLGIVFSGANGSRVWKGSVIIYNLNSDVIYKSPEQTIVPSSDTIFYEVGQSGPGFVLGAAYQYYYVGVVSSYDTDGDLDIKLTSSGLFGSPSYPSTPTGRMLTLDSGIYKGTSTYLNTTRYSNRYVAMRINVDLVTLPEEVLTPANYGGIQGTTITSETTPMTMYYSAPYMEGGDIIILVIQSTDPNGVSVENLPTPSGWTRLIEKESLPGNGTYKQVTILAKVLPGVGQIYSGNSVTLNRVIPSGYYYRSISIKAANPDLSKIVVETSSGLVNPEYQAPSLTSTVSNSLVATIISGDMSKAPTDLSSADGHVARTNLEPTVVMWTWTKDMPTSGITNGVRIGKNASEPATPRYAWAATLLFEPRPAPTHRFNILSPADNQTGMSSSYYYTYRLKFSKKVRFRSVSVPFRNADGVLNSVRIGSIIFDDNGYTKLYESGRTPFYPETPGIYYEIGAGPGIDLEADTYYKIGLAFESNSGGSYGASPMVKASVIGFTTKDSVPSGITMTSGWNTFYSGSMSSGGVAANPNASAMIMKINADFTDDDTFIFDGIVWKPATRYYDDAGTWKDTSPTVAL